MQQPQPHGGRRTGAGRKPHVPPLKRHGVYITDDQAKLLRMWGRGDVSAGLRWLMGVAEVMVRKVNRQDVTNVSE